MANRLSEDGNNDVLILEAGGKDTNFFIHMPSDILKSYQQKMMSIMVSRQSLKKPPIIENFGGHVKRMGRLVFDKCYGLYKGSCLRL